MTCREFAPAPEEPDTCKLLQTVAAKGDELASQQAFAELHTHFYGSITGFLIKNFNLNHADAEELASETMFSVWRNSHTFEGRSTVSGWIHRIATNTAISHLRRCNSRLSPVAFDDCVPEDGNVADSFPDTDANIEDEVLNRRRVYELLGRLSAREQQAVVLHDLYGYKHREIAEIWNGSPTTSRTIHLRAVKKLKGLKGDAD